MSRLCRKLIIGDVPVLVVICAAWGTVEYARWRVVSDWNDTYQPEYASTMFSRVDCGWR
jgi:hypothetical protein